MLTPNQEFQFIPQAVFNQEAQIIGMNSEYLEYICSKETKKGRRSIIQQQKLRSTKTMR